MNDPVIEDVIQDLMGTCQSLEVVLAEKGLEPETLTEAQTAQLDEGVACCDLCSWWDESCNMNEDGICEDCVAER